MNYLILALTALVPMALGFVWYGPLLGKAWIKETGLSEDELKANFNPLKVFGFSLLFSFMIAFMMEPLVIHQYSLFQLTMHFKNDPATKATLAELMTRYGNEFRTFHHGALHGALSGLFLIFPVLSINALFERKSWKYIFINSGFWIISFALMGGIICQFIKFDGF